MRWIIFTLFILNFLPRLVVAQEPNNKFGIHLAQPQSEDFEATAKLVNSEGGDWGYVTVVIQEDDRKQDKWQMVFDQLRKLHLIPIIRLATKPEGAIWRRPTKQDTDEWVSFLDSLNWVVKERYIVLFNEPNHGAEWGGTVDAENYAEVALTFAQKLKTKKSDFFIMFAGLDASAPQSLPRYQDEETFVRNVFDNVTMEQFNNLFSGLASHSYPNPDFSGSPYVDGRGTIRTYQWELNLLKQLGVNKDLPVFITETGWRRQVQGSTRPSESEGRSGKFKVQSGLEENMVADYFKIAFENVWLTDDRIKAVTPFILNYQGEPFLAFSWQKFQNSDFYQQYYKVQSLSKVQGRPVQIEKGEIGYDLPNKLLAQSSYQFYIQLKNSGQGFWDKDSNYNLSINNDKNKLLTSLFSDIKDLKPFEEKELPFFINTGSQLGKQKIKLILEKDKEKILESKDWLIEILPLPILKFKVNLFPKINDRGDDFEIQIFDRNQNLVFRKKNQDIFGGNGILENIRNIVVGEEYRVVILKPYYLPRQNFIVFKQNDNKIGFRLMVPLDFNKDGKFSLNDLLTLIKQPRLLNLFLL